MKTTVTKNTKGEIYAIRKSPNGKTIAWTESYKRIAGAMNAVKILGWDDCVENLVETKSSKPKKSSST